jgi:serine/threonine protein kinase
MIHFKQIRLLDAGGFGDAYLAQRMDNQELVVLKYLREPHLPEHRRVFLREIKILERGIRGVVGLVAKNVECPTPFYVMPYLAGGSFLSWTGKLSPGQLQAVAVDLVAALRDLHSQWMYHGDIKPANLLLDGNGRAHVADPLGNGAGCTVLFGFNHGGTPGYWAPEVRRGGQISASGDIYSVGATLHHLATGVVPQDDVPFDMSHLGGSDLTTIRRAIRACLALDPSARPDAADLLRILNGESWESIRQGREEVVKGALAIVAVFGVLAAFASAAGDGA